MEDEGKCMLPGYLTPFDVTGRNEKPLVTSSGLKQTRRDRGCTQFGFSLLVSHFSPLEVD
jgi:hypothetical protein